MEYFLMLKRRKRLALIACLVSIASVAYFFYAKEPSFDGHTLSAWVLLYAKPEKNNVATRKAQAAAAIFHIGTNSIPYLLEWLSYQEPPGKRERLVKLSKPLNWLNNYLGAKGSWALKDKDNERADAAVLAFAALGPKANAAVPALTRMFYAPKNHPGADRAGRSLANIPEHGLPLLSAALTNKEPYLRARAAHSMEQLGTNAPPVIPILIQALDDEDWQVALAASWSLRALHPDPNLAVPALTKCLEATNAVCRETAAQVLGALGHDALPAVPSLIAALADTNVGAQRVIADVLVDLAPNEMTNDTVFVIATNALHSPHVHLRVWAAYALRNFGVRARSEIPEFAVAIKDREPEVRAVSITTLAEFGREAFPAVSNVQACLLDTSPMVRFAATNALFKIAPELLTNKTWH